MNIVLATVPTPEQSWNAGSFPPLGLLYLGGGLKKLPGVRVKLVDGFGEGLSLEQTVDQILSQSPDVLGVSVMSRELGLFRELLLRIKAARPEVLTVAGGIHATLFDHLLLKEIPALDLVLRGEGDESFPELCRRRFKGEDLAGTPGLSYRASGKIIRGEPQRVEDLDSLPFPDRSLLEYPGYGTQWYGFTLPQLPSLTTVFSSRGCAFQCTFCSMTKLSKGKLRTRSAANVFEELRQLSQENYEMVIFFDDNFTGEVPRVEELCRLIIEHRLEMRLGFAGTLHNVSDATLQLMHQAGFDVIFLGVESGSDAQLKRFKKPSTRAQLASDIRRAKKAHMFVIASFIAGGPGETALDHEASKSLMKEVLPNFSEINPLMVFPGSHLWDEVHNFQEPKTLEDTESRLVSRFPHQTPKDVIKYREQDFRRALRRTFLDWRRIFILLDLLRHNRLIRTVLKRILLHPGVLLQLFKGGTIRE